MRTTFRSMGTDVVVLCERVPGERNAVHAVRRMFDEWDATLSRFRPDSELSRLNAAAGRAVVVEPLLFDAVGAALDAAAATDGLFDPTVHDRLVDLGYDRTFADLAPVRDEPSLRAWEPGRWRDIRTDRRTRTVHLPAGVALDLGGIAKGMAVDAAAELLTDRGIVPSAVDAGGDLAVRGLPGSSGWTVAVDLPAGSIDVVVPRGALATSTTLRRRWRHGDRWQHHLIDPRTGLPSTSDVVSATVAATTCRRAEVAAKTALILGWEAGSRFLERLGMDGLLALTDGATRRVGPWAAGEVAA
jgi:thiamine biosynthesis lipoprotein